MISRSPKNVHTQRVRAVHLVLPSMSERVTVQRTIGRSTPTNPFDKRIDQRPKYWLEIAARKASREHPQPFQSESHPDQALTVREIGALPDLDNVTVRITDVAANLAVLGDRLRDELGSSTFP